MKKLKYSHPAIPPQGIKLNQIYDLDELKKHMKLNKIKIMFSPIGWKWDVLQPKKRAQKVSSDKETSK